MDIRTTIYLTYGIMGVLLILFNHKMGEWNYKLALLYTDKLKIQDMFIFRINSKNRDSFFSLTRAISVILGLTFIATAFYGIYMM